jgi:branched-chain amino acid transport system ATP-binding protein
MQTALLTLERINSFYGRAHILQDLGFTVVAGEVLMLLGRNGAGKSTVMKTVIGLVRPRSGRIIFDGTGITGVEPHRIARLGLGYVPEDRRVFKGLSVGENLEVGRQPPRAGLAPWTSERVFALFPNLSELRDRLAGQMSGGEQQMLTIARTLMGNPRLLLLDEPSEGLAPVIVDLLVRAILALKREGVTLLLAEQNLHFASRVADRAVVIEKGRIVWSGTMPELRADERARAAYLAV